MLLKTYVTVSALLAAVPARVERRVRTRHQDDTGLATLEWVALVIIALGLAGAAGIALNKVLQTKIADIK
jgi:hypothetical protein